MNSQIQAKLKNILAYPFFHSVGGNLPASTIGIKSWRGAFEECNSRRWQNNRLMARNYLFDLVQRRSWARAQDWGPLSDELRPLIVSFADRIKMPIPEQFRGRIKDALSWDIMLICFEYEYQDLVEPPFYVPLLEPWYSRGHFPCGWDGEEFPDDWDGMTPSGNVIVF